MDRLLLLHGGHRRRLSLLSPQDWSVREDHQNLLLSFCGNGSSCGGLLYFDNFKGKSVICNPKTRAMKLLDPPAMPPPPYEINIQCTGFGYDCISDDYKVVRILRNHHFCNPNVCHYCRGKPRYNDTEVKGEVFSLKTDSWKQIKFGDFEIGVVGFRNHGSGVHVNGCYYWIRYSHRFSSVVSFDFTGECFSSIGLPPRRTDLLDDVVKVDDDVLGVIRYARPSRGFGVFNNFQLLVLKESSWVPWVSVDLCDVERPLPLVLNQGRFLFFEKKISKPRMRQLVVYDLEAKKLEELDIYDYVSMKIFCYVESRFPLRDSKAMDVVYSQLEEERKDEEEKERVRMEEYNRRLEKGPYY